MNQIIQIDKNTRIKNEPLNWMLQRRRVSKGKEAWRTVGYYADLISIAADYINEAPAREENAIKSIEKLIEVIARSSDNISRIFDKNL